MTLTLREQVLDRAVLEVWGDIERYNYAGRAPYDLPVHWYGRRGGV